jgi:ribosomal protein L37AE/L43A
MREFKGDFCEHMGKRECPICKGPLRRLEGPIYYCEKCEVDFLLGMYAFYLLTSKILQEKK